MVQPSCFGINAKRCWRKLAFPLQWPGGYVRTSAWCASDTMTGLRRVLTACGAELRADIRSVLWLKDHMHGGSTAGERGNLYCCNRKQLIATSAPEVEKS